MKDNVPFAMMPDDKASCVSMIPFSLKTSPEARERTCPPSSSEGSVMS